MTPKKTAFKKIVHKGENAGNQHFLLSLKCFLSFQKPTSSPYWTVLCSLILISTVHKRPFSHTQQYQGKNVLLTFKLGMTLNSLPNNILDSSKLKETADDNFNFDENGRRFSERVENNVGKRELLITCNFSYSYKVF